MYPYISVFGITLPSYGLMIALGLTISNLLAMLICRQRSLSTDELLLLEAYAVLGGLLGAKLLYLAVSWREIDWPRFFTATYFNQLMQGGFVFYGGLIGGVSGALLAGQIHHISTTRYLRSLVFLLPLAHAFGRIGCFLAGCCYGVPYDGPLSVTYPSASFAPSGIPIFPVQLVEAACLLCLSLVLSLVSRCTRGRHVLSTYLMLYSLVRFFLERYRYDEARGFILALSVSQWISLLLIVAGAVIFLIERRQHAVPLEPSFTQETTIP